VFRSPLNLYRTVAIAEAVSWTLLLGGLLLRAVAGLDWAVSIGGGIHGFVVLAYVATTVLVAKNQHWTARPALLALVATVVPYATVPLELWLHRSGRLAGAWRLAARADDPRDRTWHDRAFRAAISRPLLLGGGLVAAVALAFAVLLVAGPPVPKA
jgi:integral membrane protein